MEEYLGETITVKLSTTCAPCQEQERCGSREVVIFFDCDRDTYRCGNGHWISEEILDNCEREG
jgi:hypothetical protein